MLQLNEDYKHKLDLSYWNRAIKYFWPKKKEKDMLEDIYHQKLTKMIMVLPAKFIFTGNADNV